MTRPDPRTIVTPQLVGRWLAEIGAHIRDEQFPEVRALTTGSWDTMSASARTRLTEIGVDLLVRLDDAGVLTKVNRSLIPRVQRDFRGRRMGSPVAEGMPAGSAASCTCGRPTTLGTVHRIEGPCYVPGRESTDLRTALGSRLDVAPAAARSSHLVNGQGQRTNLNGDVIDPRMTGTAERVDLGDDPDGDLAAVEAEGVRPLPLDAGGEPYDPQFPGRAGG